jgi:hypothetical protein
MNTEDVGNIFDLLTEHIFNELTKYPTYAYIMIILKMFMIAHLVQVVITSNM